MCYVYGSEYKLGVCSFCKASSHGLSFCFVFFFQITDPAILYWGAIDFYYKVTKNAVRITMHAGSRVAKSLVKSPSHNNNIIPILYIQKREITDGPNNVIIYNSFGI